MRNERHLVPLSMDRIPPPAKHLFTTEFVFTTKCMAANLNPSDEALEPEIIGLIKSMVSEMPASKRETPAGRREIKVTSMMLSEPNIELKELQSIKAPTLILAADHDAIRVKHTVDMINDTVKSLEKMRVANQQ